MLESVLKYLTHVNIEHFGLRSFRHSGYGRQVFDVNGSVPESLQEKVVEVDTALLDRPEPHTKRPLIEARAFCTAEEHCKI